MTKVLLVGCGNMGFAMLRRWATDADLDLIVVEPAPHLRARAIREGATAFESVEALPSQSAPEVLVLATKPQLVAEVLRSARGVLGSSSLVVSVAAGIPLSAMQSELPNGMGLVRCMPNTPASVGEAMTVCVASHSCSAAQKDLTARLMSAVGRVAFADDEAFMDAVTAVSGSGPAYVFHFIECLARAGERAGLPPDIAMLLAKQTSYGATALAIQSTEHPGRLREQVTSPNGTTAAGLDVLMCPDSGFDVLLDRCVDAAKRRSIELGRS